MGNDGLLSRQKRDEERHKEIIEEIRTIKDAQEILTEGQSNQNIINANINKRLESVEDFLMWFRALTSVKKKYAAFIGFMLSVFGVIFTKFQEIIEQIKSIITP